MSYTYECLTNDNDQIDNAGHVLSSSPRTISTVPRTVATHKGGKIKKKTPWTKNKGKTGRNVPTSVRNTEITNKQSAPSVVKEAGTVAKTENEGRNSADDISTMTGSTESATRKIDISDIFFDTTAVTDPHTIKKRRKRKSRRSRTQGYGKQAATSDDDTGGQKRTRNNEQQEGTSSSNEGYGNDDADRNPQNNDPPMNPFNDDRCPGKLVSEESVDVKDFQTYIVTIKFKEVPKDKKEKVIKAYTFECMTKVPDITFYPSNKNTLLTPNPFSTKETFPLCSIRFREFFHVDVSEEEVKVYYKVKCSVPVTEIRNRVFKFLTNKHV